MSDGGLGMGGGGLDEDNGRLDVGEVEGVVAVVVVVVVDGWVVVVEVIADE